MMDQVQALLERTSGFSSPIVPQMLIFLFGLFSYNSMLLSAQSIIGLGFEIASKFNLVSVNAEYVQVKT